MLSFWPDRYDPVFTSILSNNEEFWVDYVSLTGDYDITITHSDGTASASVSGTVFEFSYDVQRDTSVQNGSHGGTGTVDVAAGTISAAANYSSSTTISDDAEVVWGYDVEIVTTPSGSYTGDVEGVMNILFLADGDVKLVNWREPSNADSPSIGINFGIVTYTLSGTSGSNPYGSSLVAADAAIKIDTLAWKEAGEKDYDYTMVPPPPWYQDVSSETWNETLDPAATDDPRTFTVGTTKVPIQVKLGTGSRLTRKITDPVSGAKKSPYVEKNDWEITTVDANELSGEFEIVP